MVCFLMEIDIGFHGFLITVLYTCVSVTIDKVVRWPMLRVYGVPGSSLL